MSGDLLEWADLEKLLAMLCKMKSPDQDSCDYLIERAIQRIEKEKGGLATSCFDAEVCFDDAGKRVELEIDPVADIPDAADQIRKMGNPIQVRFLTGSKGADDAWDEKYAFLYLIEQRKVWFEFEKYGAQEKLVRASLIY